MLRAVFRAKRVQQRVCDVLCAGGVLGLEGLKGRGAGVWFLEVLLSWRLWFGFWKWACSALQVHVLRLEGFKMTC